MYGWRGLRITAGPRPASSIRPAYITTTSSQVSEITPRSCETRITAIPFSCWNSTSSARICSWVVTSSAVVGSSASSSFGRAEIAIAIITRCRMPPLN